MYYVNTYQGFIPARPVVPAAMEFVTDVRYAKPFASFADADEAGKQALAQHGRQVQYYAVLGASMLTSAEGEGA